MPTGLIVTLAVVIVVLAAGLTTFLRVRRDQAATFEPAIRATRARLESLTYEIDTAPAGVATTEAARLRDTVEAMLATADDRRSASICDRADELLGRGERALHSAHEDAAASGERGHHDGRQR